MAENEQKVGQVTHFFAGPSAAVLKLTGSLKVGDQIHIVGFTTDLVENLTSMQIEHNSVQTASTGDDVAILVKDRVREGDEVFVVAPGTIVQPRQVAMTPAPASAMVASAATPVSAPKPAVAPKPAPKAAAKPKAKPKAKARPNAKKAKAKVKKTKTKPKAKAKPKKKDKSKAKKKKR